MNFLKRYQKAAQVNTFHTDLDLGDVMREKRVVPKIYRYCAYSSVSRLSDLVVLGEFSHLPSLHHELDAHSFITEPFHIEFCAV